VSDNDTIAAIATAPGRGAIGVLRVSGPRVPQIGAAILGVLPLARRAHLSGFLDADGSVLDEGLALYFEAPHSFTGEHVLELQGHGGLQVMDLLLQRVFTLGARPARAGEFSERAFLNGKIDIAQAEAIADLIDAGSGAAARAAVRSLRGEFSARIVGLQAKLTELRKLVEAAIDFPDEEIDFASHGALNGHLVELFAAFDSISAAARQGALLREGLNIVIAGRPNAGKSSLLNRLSGEEIAIVTAQPGTTRDVLRQALEIDGLPINLIDTAGLRETHDVVEAEGVRRAQHEIGQADHVLYLIDATSQEPLDELNLDAAGTVVFNKIDLLNSRHFERAGLKQVQLSVSAKTGEGFEALRLHLKKLAGFEQAGSGTFSARRRHLDALNRARESVERAAHILKTQKAVELFAEELRLAQRALGEITGEFTSDDLLGEIFSSFCIGK
jgi:tRNA modification GTPase